jgi:hypothetical protein
MLLGLLEGQTKRSKPRNGIPAAGHTRKLFCHDVALSSQTLRFMYNASLVIYMSIEAKSIFLGGKDTARGITVEFFQTRVLVLGR